MSITNRRNNFVDIRYNKIVRKYDKTFVEFEKVKSRTKLIMNREFSTVIHVSTRIIPNSKNITAHFHLTFKKIKHTLKSMHLFCRSANSRM